MKQPPRLRRVSSRLTAPASPSFTCEALLLAAATPGNTRLLDLLDFDDTRYLMEAITRIGHEVRGTPREGIEVGERVSISAGEVEIDVGSSPEAFRALLTFLSFTPGRFLLRCSLPDPFLQPHIEMLRRLGGEIETPQADDLRVLEIRGKISRGGFDFFLATEQHVRFARSLIPVAGNIRDGFSLSWDEPAFGAMIGRSVETFQQFGGQVTHTEGRVRIRGNLVAVPEFRAPPDEVAMAHWLVAAGAIGGEIAVTCNTDDAALEIRKILTAQGCQVSVSDGGFILRSEGLAGGTIDLRRAWELVPLITAIAPSARTSCEILLPPGFDRESLSRDLASAGVRSQMGSDPMTIEQGWEDRTELLSFSDGRMTMAVAVAGLSRGGLTIDETRQVDQLYPRFWRTMDELVRDSERAPTLSSSA